jgi:hypothetical protein
MCSLGRLMRVNWGGISVVIVLILRLLLRLRLD